MGLSPGSADVTLEDFESLRRLARSLLRDAGERIDDVVQDAWLRGARPGADARAGGEGLRGSGWWSTVLRNVDRSRRRADRVRAQHEREVAAGRFERSEADDPARSAQRLEAVRTMLDALEGLEEPYRGAITLRYLEGLTPRAIAARSGRPVRTVHTHLQRGLAMLRARLESQAGRRGDRRAWITALMPLAAMGKKSMIGWASAGVLGLGALFGFVVVPLFGGDGEAPSSGGEPRVAAVSSDSSGDQELLREAVEVPEPAAEEPLVEVVLETLQIEVKGLVVDAADQPVPGVTVQFEPFVPVGAPVAVSDADGRFTMVFGGQPMGNLRCLSDDWTALYEPVLWGQEKEEERKLTLVVGPAVTVRGRVFDAETTEALADVGLHVTAELPAAASFARDLSRCRPAEWRGTSGGDGRFAVRIAAGLPRVQIHSALAGYEHGHQEVPDPSLDVLVPLQPSGAVLRGQVVDARGEPAGGAAVLCGPAATMADEQGFFAIDLTHVRAQDGSQRHRLLVASRTGELPAQLLGPAETWRDASSWPRPLVLRLGEPALSIHGKVVGLGGSPVEGAQVRALDEQPLGEGETANESWHTVEFHARVSIDVDENGTSFSEFGMGGAPGHFSVSGLQPRAYRLRVSDPKALRATITEPIAAGTSGLEIALPEEPLWDSVGGVVVDRRGQPVPDVTVTMRRRFDDQEGVEPLSLQLRTDAEGRFRTAHPVTRSLDEMTVQAVGLARGVPVDLAAHSDFTDLRIVAPIAVRTRIVATPASQDAQRAAFVDADGKVLAVVITRGDTAFGQMHVPLTEGATEVLEVSDAAVELVLFRASGERTRHPVELVPSTEGPVEIRP